jgi:hypothetical protein
VDFDCDESQPCIAFACTCPDDCCFDDDCFPAEHCDNGKCVLN